MNKSKKSVLNSMSGVAWHMTDGLLGIFFTSLIIKNFGSDFNGIYSAANQIVSILYLLEGGFTIAINVAMFKPYGNKETDTVNSILSAANIRFKQIGVLFISMGTIVSWIYTKLVVSSLDSRIVFAVMVMSLIPTFVTLVYSTKYRILIQAEQKEYVISLCAMSTITVGYAVNIVAMIIGCRMLTVRFISMLFATLQSFVIAWYCKRHFKGYDFKAKPDFSLIKGMKDIMAQKITGVLYRTLPILTISMMTTAGTMVASVYASYNSIYQVIKALLYAVMDGPRLSLGQLIAERDSDYVYRKFISYEFITVVALGIFLSTTVIMIIPFITWYSRGFSDINYINYNIAIALALTTFAETLHIPSGNYINMSGNFRVSRNIQLVSMVVLVASMAGFVKLFGFYGVIYGVLATAVFLAVAEISFVHVKIFRRMKEFIKIIAVNGIAMFIYCYIGGMLVPKNVGFVTFIMWAGLVFCISIAYVGAVNFIFNRRYCNDVAVLLKNVAGRLK